MDNKNKKNKYFFALSILLILLDQITKLSIKGFNICGIEHQGMFFGQSISVIGDFLQITYIENSGMALGISFGSGKIFLSLFSIFASIALIWYLHKLRNFSLWIQLGISLILAGAVGNLIDRVFYGVLFNESSLFYGSVVDFIQFDIPDINILGLRYTHFPVFNVADSCVSCGVTILLIFHKKIPTLKQLINPGIESIKIEENTNASSEKQT